jgi:hypothetical protein
MEFCHYALASSDMIVSFGNTIVYQIEPFVIYLLVRNPACTSVNLLFDCP